MPKDIQKMENLPATVVYEPGMTLESVQATMREHMAMEPANETALLQRLQKYDPSYTITPEDRIQRPGRALISTQAREQFIEIVYRQNMIKQGRSMDRGAELFLDLSGSEGAQAYNERVMRAFAFQEGSVHPDPNLREERNAIIHGYVENLGQMDMDRLYHLKDQELLEEFPKLYGVMLLAMEGADNMSKNKDYDISPEDMQKLQNLKKDHQTLFAHLKDRYELMMDPNYALIHTDRVSLNPITEADLMMPFADGEGDYELEHPEESKYFTLMASFQLNKTLLQGETLQKALQENNLGDLQGLRCVTASGRRLESNLNVITRQTEPLFIMNPNGKGALYMDPRAVGKDMIQKADGLTLNPTNPQNRQKAGDLLKGLEAADPWNLRLFAGSREFAAMKKSMAQVSEIMERMPLMTNNAQKSELLQALETLQTTSQNYLGTKSSYAASQKETERARILAATQVWEFAAGMREMIDYNVQVGNNMKRMSFDPNKAKNSKARQDAMGKQMDDELNFVAPRRMAQLNEDTAPQWENGETMVHGARLKQVRKYYHNMMPKYDENDPAMEYLCMDIMEAIGKTYKVPTGDGKMEELKLHNMETFYDKERFAAQNPDPNEKNPVDPTLYDGAKSIREDVRMLVAKVVTLDLIHRERVQSRGTSDQIRQRFDQGRKAFLNAIANTKTLKEVVDNMGPEDLRTFMDTAVGIRHIDPSNHKSGKFTLEKLTTKVLGEMSQKVEQKDGNNAVKQDQKEINKDGEIKPKQGEGIHP